MRAYKDGTHRPETLAVSRNSLDPDRAENRLGRDVDRVFHGGGTLWKIDESEL